MQAWLADKLRALAAAKDDQRAISNLNEEAASIASQSCCFQGVPPPTIIDLPINDVPQVLSRIEIRGGWWPHQDFFLLLCS